MQLDNLDYANQCDKFTLNEIRIDSKMMLVNIGLMTADVLLLSRVVHLRCTLHTPKTPKPTAPKKTQTISEFSNGL